MLGSSPAMMPEMLVDVSYAAPQAHRIINVALHWEYSPGIVFIFSLGRKDLYRV
jgi:predicted nicotinamide N-methyase